MTSIGAREAKSQLSELLDRVASGERILITRNGKPAALLIAPPVPSKNVQNVIQAILDFRDNEGPTLGEEISIRELIDTGRS